MPATERCPGQPGVALEFFILATRFVLGHGCDPSGYGVSGWQFSGSPSSKAHRVRAFLF
jgi:hypothetical protein